MSTKKKRQGSTLTSYFNKLPKHAVSGRSCEQDDTGPDPTTAVVHNEKGAESSSSEKLPLKPSEASNQNDIGVYAGCPTIPEDVKERVYKNTWTPCPRHDFEISISKDGKRRKFQLNWLQRFQWLAYSDVQKGAFCKVCVLFSMKSGTGKGSHESARSLVTSPFTKWKNALEVFENHAKTEYHKDATIVAQSFLEVSNGKIDNIHLQLSKQAKIESEKNKAMLQTIIETVLVCGRQEIALRGDRDSGRLTLEEPAKNDGNFRALLRYRARGGDQILVDHIKTSGGNALYTSPTVQNELIAIIGKQIQDRIVQAVNKSGFFSVLADGTTDGTQTEQFSLCVRYVEHETMDIKEDFLAFVSVSDLSGSGLANTLKTELIRLGLDLKLMRGQGYDGAAVMSGSFRGVQALIREEYPTAVYTHCSSHSLNLCLNDASKVSDIRNAFATISEICSYFRSSSKRTDVLKKQLETSSRTFTRLHKYCETRWVERHEAVILFSEALPDIVESLEVIMESEAGRNATASSLHSRLCSFNFLVCLAVSERFLSLTLRLSQYLQGHFVDMSIALEHIDLVLKQLNDMREDAEDQFKEIFRSCEETAKGFGVHPDMPRKVGSQKYRENHASSSPEEYYRRACFIPYLDDLRSALSERFTAHRAMLYSLQLVLPKYTAHSSFESLQPAVEFYMADMQPQNLKVIKAEWEIWKQKWREIPSEQLPKYATEALKQCNTSLFPNLHTLLNILATLPVTTATAERSFSTLKRLKTYLRNSSVEERLNGLALMSLYRESVDVSNVIATFTKKARRLVF